MSAAPGKKLNGEMTLGQELADTVVADERFRAHAAV
jgi:hypothetical protein